MTALSNKYRSIRDRASGYVRGATQKMVDCGQLAAQLALLSLLFYIVVVLDSAFEFYN